MAGQVVDHRDGIWTGLPAQDDKKDVVKGWAGRP